MKFIICKRQMTTLFDSLVGDTLHQISITASSIEYPTSELANVFGQIYLPRIYGKDLTTFEIASSGNIAITLCDVHALDISNVSSNVVINPVLGNSLILANSPSSEARIELSSSEKSVSITASNAISLSSGSNCTFSMDGTDIVAYSPNNFTINAKNDIVLKGHSLNIDVQELSISYAFKVNPTGALQLVQKVMENGENVARVVATFGFNKVL